MALKITRATDALDVGRLIVVVYGQPGIGKTTLAFSAARPLMLAFDRGTHRAALRGDSVQIEQWSDIADLDRASVAGYETLIVDTAGQALDALAADIMRRSPKLGRGGQLTLQGYGSLKAQFTAWMKHLRTLGVDIVLTAHADEQRMDDTVQERIEMVGSSRNEVYKSADVMARLGIVGGQRTLTMAPTDTSFGKDPAGIGSRAVPSSDAPNGATFLADLIGEIRGRMRERNAAQASAAAVEEEVAASAEPISDETIEAMTKTARELRDSKASAEVQKSFARTAEESGLRWDKDSGGFVRAETAA